MAGITNSQVSARDVSRLPEDVIHHILSYLGPKEAIETCTFCKTWHSAWLTRHTLNFSASKDMHSYSCDLKEKFFGFIKKTLWRHQEKNICIGKLVMEFTLNSFSASLVDELIGIIVQTDIQRLQLDFHPLIFWKLKQSYTMPDTIFEAETLIELVIRGREVKLEKKVGDKVMFTRLQKLHLVNIQINDDMFEGIISSCPWVDDLLVNCMGLKRIKVTGLGNLKKLTVYVKENQSFEIYAPRLQYLDIHTSYYAALPLATFFDNFGHKFPQLEDLSLAVCNGLQRINISSPSLKRIRLSSMLELREIEIDAPSLISFEFLNIIVFPDLLLINTSSQWVSKISTSTSYRLSMLEALLEKLIQSKISLALRSSFYVGNHIPMYPPEEVEELHLDWGFPTPCGQVNFLDSFFRTCHPKAIIVTRRLDIARYLYKKLIEGRKHHTTGQGTNSWYRKIKEAKYEVVDNTKKDRQASDWKSWTPELQYQERVCFRLEWEAPP